MQSPTNNPLIASFLKDFFLEVERASSIVLISHDNMDPDAIGSIVGIIDLIKNVIPGSKTIGVHPPSISKLSRRLLDTWNIDLPFVTDLPASDFLPVLLDTQNVATTIKASAGEIEALQARCVIVDHHQPQGLTSRLSLITSDVQANCEIVIQFFQVLEKQPNSIAANALMAGIWFDSSSLRYARESTVRCVNFLLDTGVRIEDFKGMMNEPMDISERIARLKAGMRCTLTRAGNVIIATSEVSTFEASACRGLIGLGADIAMVLAESKGEARISARQTAECHKTYKINLASIMRSIAGTLNGTGGGHELAAAASGPGDGATSLKEAIKNIEAMINASTSTP